MANDQKGPFDKHVKGTAQQRSRVGGVTLLLHLSGSSRQACQLSGELDCSRCCFQTELVNTHCDDSASFLNSNFAAHSRIKHSFLVIAQMLILDV